MRILVVAATPQEIAAVVDELRHTSTSDRKLTSYLRGATEVDVLVTGVGMVPTAAWCSRALSQRTYDLALNVGVCGSFVRTIEPGTVVHVVTDRFSEMGAEDGDAFLTLEELNLVHPDEPPFITGQLLNTNPPAHPVLRELPEVNGITVNTVHGNDESIVRVYDRFRPQVETMEGAAFMYACLIHGQPFAQVRAVSNIVERRNRRAWKMTYALRQLCETTLRVLDDA